MNPLPITEAVLQAYVDARLPAGLRAEVERYLEMHAEDARRIAAYRAQSDSLRSLYAPVLDEPVPERLTQALRPRRSQIWRAAAALALVALGVAAGWQMHGAYEREERVASIAHDAAVAHAVYSPEVRHAVEVGADQESHLVAWLSKRLGTKVRAPNLEAVGYSLMGGRLLPGEGPSGQATPTAQFMYQCKKGTRITLYVRTRVREQDETAFRYERDGRIGVFYWIDRSLGYALSSADIGREDLLRVANAAYAQLNP